MRAGAVGMMPCMDPNIVSGLIGFGGAVLGAAIGGTTSLIATKLTLNHQRKQLMETRLQELGQAATDSALSELIQLGKFLGEIKGSEVQAHIDEDLPWIETAGLHLKHVELAVARIPDRSVYHRMQIPLETAYRFRAAGPRHFFAIRWVGNCVTDMIAALSAALRHDELPAPTEEVVKAQQKVIEYDEKKERHFEALVAQARIRAGDDEPPADPS